MLQREGWTMRLILAVLVFAIMVFAGLVVTGFGDYDRHSSSAGTQIVQGAGGCGGCL